MSTFGIRRGPTRKRREYIKVIRVKVGDFCFTKFCFLPLLV